jgi:hypothetical protein
VPEWAKPLVGTDWIDYALQFIIPKASLPGHTLKQVPPYNSPEEYEDCMWTMALRALHIHGEQALLDDQTILTNLASDLDTTPIHLEDIMFLWLTKAADHAAKKVPDLKLKPQAPDFQPYAAPYLLASERVMESWELLRLTDRANQLNEQLSLPGAANPTQDTPEKTSREKITTSCRAELLPEEMSIPIALQRTTSLPMICYRDTEEEVKNPAGNQERHQICLPKDAFITVEWLEYVADHLVPLVKQGNLAGWIGQLGNRDTLQWALVLRFIHLAPTTDDPENHPLWLKACAKRAGLSTSQARAMIRCWKENTQMYLAHLYQRNMKQSYQWRAEKCSRYLVDEYELWDFINKEPSYAALAQKKGTLAMEKSRERKRARIESSMNMMMYIDPICTMDFDHANEASARCPEIKKEPQDYPNDDSDDHCQSDESDDETGDDEADPWYPETHKRPKKPLDKLDIKASLGLGSDRWIQHVVSHILPYVQAYTVETCAKHACNPETIKWIIALRQYMRTCQPIVNMESSALLSSGRVLLPVWPPRLPAAPEISPGQRKKSRTYITLMKLQKKMSAFTWLKGLSLASREANPVMRVTAWRRFQWQTSAANVIWGNQKPLNQTCQPLVTRPSRRFKRT